MASPLYVVSEGNDFEIEAVSRQGLSTRKTLVKFDGTLQRAIFPAGGVQVGNVPDITLLSAYQVIAAASAAQAAAAGCTIVADVLPANGALTVAAQPDVPRKLNVIVTDANASITAGIVTLVGLDQCGNAIQEQVSLVTAGTKVTANAYSVLTSATISGLAGQGAADRVAIGFGAALALLAPAGSNFSVYKEGTGATVAAAVTPETVGTVDAVARTVVPTTAADGTKALHFWYKYSA